MRTRIIMEILMEGDAVACKEIIAVELERNLLEIGQARVRCLGATIEEDEQLSMSGGRGSPHPPLRGTFPQGKAGRR
jgi:hypothetical protein